MNLHLGSTTAFVVLALIFTIAQAFGAVRSYNIRPQHARCTEFGYFKEVIGTDAEIEFNLLGYHCGRQTSINQLVHILITPSQSITQLLEDIRTGIVQCQCIYIEYTIFRKGSSRFNQRLGCRYHIAFFLTLSQHLVEVVIIDGTLQLRQVIILLPEISDKKFCKFHHVSLAGREIQLDTFCADVFQ